MRKNSPNLMVILIACLISVFCTIMYSSIRETTASTLGIKAVKSLYEFNNLEEFDNNIEIFHSYVSEDVFTQMTADNTDRILQVYLKFKANPCNVNIIEATPNYIVYSLVSESIESDRRFLFTYKVKNGKITGIIEAELFMLPSSRGWDIDDTLLPPLDMPYGGE